MAERDEKGRLLPGHKKVGGRTKQKGKELLEAIADAHTPDEMRENLRWIVSHAKERGWPKVVLAVHTFEIEQLNGRPKVHIESGDSNAIDEAMQRMAEMEAENEQAEIAQMLGE